MSEINLGDIKFSLPAQWACSSAAFAPTGDVQPGSFRRNLVVAWDTLQRDPQRNVEKLASYLQRVEAQLRQSGVFFMGRPKVTDGKIPGATESVISEHRIKGPTGPVRQLQLLVAKADKLVILTLSEMDGDAFEDARPQFEACIASLKF